MTGFKNSNKVDKDTIISRAGGLIFTLILNGAIALYLSLSGYSYLYPPPPEMNLMLVEFVEPEEEPEKIDQVTEISRTTAETVVDEPQRDLVQKAESTVEGNTENNSAETTIGEDGDVEVPTPPEPKPIKERALFKAVESQSDSVTKAHTAKEATSEMTAGQPDGNVEESRIVSAEPAVRLEGRKLKGNLPKPNHIAGNDGKVVVEIWVDNYGNVVSAQAGVTGTTITDKALWNETYKAAMAAKFEHSVEAEARQRGTITYIFKSIAD